MVAAAALLDGLLGAATLAKVCPLLLRKAIFIKVLFNKVIFRNVIFKKVIFRIRLAIFRIITLPKNIQDNLIAFLIHHDIIFNERMGLHQVSMIDLV